MIEKLKVTRDQKQAIDYVLSNYEVNEILRDHAYTSKPWKSKKTKALNDLNLEQIAKACLIGYELEETPEEKILELYTEQTVDYKFDKGYKVGVKDTLNTFGITVKGINE